MAKKQKNANDNDDDGVKPVRCKHLLCISATKLSTRLSTCERKVDEWLCLTCGSHFGVNGRTAHGRAHNHPLFNMGDLFWCVNCGQAEWSVERVEQPKLRSHVEEILLILEAWRKSSPVSQKSVEVEAVESSAGKRLRRGLINLGNTCFMNSTLQALSSLQILSECDGDPVSTALFACLNELVTSGKAKHPVDPSPLFSLLCRRNREWGRMRQQDAHDFLHSLFNALDELKADWHRKIFGGQITFAVNCNTCRSTSAHQQNCLDISLSLPLEEDGEEEERPKKGKRGTLEEEMSNLTLADTNCISTMLQEWSKPVRLEGANAFACEHCTKREGVTSLQPATQTMTLSRLPRVLIIHLQRFLTRSSRRGGVEKDHRQVQVPPQITIQDTVYHLKAMVVHEGGSVSSGHYVACIHDGDDWWLCSDTRVSKLSNLRNHNPYLVFYQSKS